MPRRHDARHFVEVVDQRRYAGPGAGCGRGAEAALVVGIDRIALFGPAGGGDGKGVAVVVEAMDTEQYAARLALWQPCM